MTNVPKVKSFDEMAEYYLHRAIASDLQFLLQDRPLSPEYASSYASSNDRTPLLSSVSSSSLEFNLKPLQSVKKFPDLSSFSYMPTNMVNTVCQVRSVEFECFCFNFVPQVQFKHVHRNYMLPEALLNIQIG